MYRLWLRAGALTAILCLWVAMPRPAAAQQFSVRTLGTLSNAAGGINNQAVITGSFASANGNDHAFRLEDTVVRDLGTLGGIFSEGYAINSVGAVVGLSANQVGDYHAYIWPDPTTGMRDLDGRVGHYSEAWAINTAGLVAGVAETTTITNPRTFHAALWQGTSMFDLGTLGGQDSEAYGINTSGVIVGSAQTATVNGVQHEHAAFWTSSNTNPPGAPSGPTDLGVLPGGLWSYAYAVNDAGRVVGVAQTASRAFHAVTWDNLGIHDLGTLLSGTFSEALAVNSSHQIVGSSSWPTDDFTRHAFLWQNGQMSDLNGMIAAGSGWVLMRATGINDKGQIIGEGTLNGVPALFVLTPITTG